MEATREYPLGERSFQLSRLSARDGSWITFQFLNSFIYAALKNPEDVDEKELAAAIASRMSMLAEDIFERVQAKALGVVKGKDADGNYMPLFHKDSGANLFNLAQVEMTVLTLASLSFNLRCFFEPGAKEMLLTTVPDLSKPAAPGSTATS